MAYDAFLKIDGVTGESQKDKHKGEIELGSFSLGAMNPTSVTSVGGSQAHLNMQPFLVINFSIALQGIFPSQT